MKKPFPEFVAIQFSQGLYSFLAISAFSGMGMAEELNIYSHRQSFLIQPFIDAYEEKTEPRSMLFIPPRVSPSACLLKALVVPQM